MSELISCPHCMSQNAADHEVCDYCGTPLYSTASIDEDHFAAGYSFSTEPSEVELSVEPWQAPAGSQSADIDAASEVDYDLEFAEDSDDADSFPQVQVEVEGADDFGGGELGEDFDFSADDDLAADGGMQLDAPIEQAFELNDPTQDESLDAQDSSFDEAGEAAAAQAEEPTDPEMAAILNPAALAHEPIEALPQPGPYAQPASLRVFQDGMELGLLAIDAPCTVLGQNATTHTPVAPLGAQADDSSSELVLEEGSQAAEEDAFELEELSAPHADAQSAGDSEDSNLLEEGPVIDLSRFGDTTKFARRHGYIFRQNKNYTLYVLSDLGTQLNDEMLALGEHRALSAGDVIILGGEVALQFDLPTA